MDKKVSKTQEVTLNRKELKRIRKLLKEKEVGKNQQVTIITSSNSGIGLNVYVKIEGFDEQFDVTDYSSW